MNALSMTSINSAISFAEDDFTVDKLAKCVTKFLSAPKKAEAMAAAALKRSSENSVKVLSDLIVNLAREKKEVSAPAAKPFNKGTS